jgi:hypothetical protein
MTKAELREKLLGGAVMDNLFAFRNGQDCEIFKATRFERSDDIIYIPDLALNLIPVTEPANGPEDVEEIVGCCYTGNDFIEECGGDVEKARHLFWYCDWQHPSSALPEIDDEEGE